MTAFSWHETTRILLILPIIKTVAKLNLSIIQVTSVNFCLLRNTDMAIQGTWKFRDLL